MTPQGDPRLTGPIRPVEAAAIFTAILLGVLTLALTLGWLLS